MNEKLREEEEKSAVVSEDQEELAANQSQSTSETTISSGIERLTNRETSPSAGEESSRDSKSGEETAERKNPTGGEKTVIQEDLMDQDYEDAIKAGQVKRVSGKLHHVSSSDSFTSSTKSSCSSSDS